MTAASNYNAYLPCNRVLSIMELQEQICCYLNAKDFKRCSVVCNYWYSMFGAYRWIQLHLWHKHPREFVMERYGGHIKSLKFWHVDKDILKAIELCPNVDCLDLVLDYNSMWVTYATLESVFVRLQGRLKKIVVRFDVAYFCPSFLWSLCCVPHLAELHLDPYDSEDSESRPDLAKQFVGLLECCPSLQSVVFLPRERFGYGELCFRRSKTASVKRCLRRITNVGTNRPPSTVQEAMARRAEVQLQETNVKRLVSADLSNPDTTIVETTPLRPDSNLLRRLRLQSSLLPITTLYEIIPHCRQLDEIILGGRSHLFSSITWITIATHCRQLRILRFWDMEDMCVLPDVPEFITRFPHLEELEFNMVVFKEEPDVFTDFEAALREHEKKYGHKHPLRVLHLTGNLRRPTRVLGDLLALPSSNIESVTVGGMDVDRHIREIGSASEPFVAGLLDRYEFKAPWTCMETLTHLDFSKVEIRNEGRLERMFGCFRDPGSRLRSLVVSISHIRGMISCETYSYRNSWQVNFRPWAAAAGTTTTEEMLSLLGCNLWFGTIERLTVRPMAQWFSSFSIDNRDMDLFEGRLVVAASPRLKGLVLKEGTMSHWNVGMLGREYPRIFVESDCEDCDCRY
ncbi:hypothetical protein BGX23_007933 [Mortierella sp. AD031]|nr:hypothetical protein BGX23_007933 [Mortierella sp. AD031]